MRAWPGCAVRSSHTPMFLSSRTASYRRVVALALLSHPGEHTKRQWSAPRNLVSTRPGSMPICAGSHPSAFLGAHKVCHFHSTIWPQLAYADSDGCDYKGRKQMWATAHRPRHSCGTANKHGKSEVSPEAVTRQSCLDRDEVGVDMMPIKFQHTEVGETSEKD
ncbi:hypothetical protein NDU88_011050 [Pleurodeles waltl]|uniref:Uncharacterized protein n=1 Tax=Pleurodeles waltl TaxID=8319 RepID=A0AAV7S497_PLEWA|nr:hypothetical protein NDU88_011050 [Pleurodeles waltl]